MRPSTESPRQQRWQALPLSLGVVALLTALAVVPLPTPVLALLSWSTSVLLCVATLIGARSTIRRLSPKDPARRFWWAIGFNAGVVGVGYLVQIGGSGTGFAAGVVVQTMVALGALVLVAVMLTYPLRVTTARNRFCFWLDMTTVMVAAAVSGWYVTDPGAGGGSAVVAVLTGPVVMLVAVFAVAKLLLAGRPPFGVVPGLLGAASAVTAAMLSAFGGTLLEYGGGGVFFALSALGDALMMIAAWTQSRQIQRRPDSLDRPRRSYSTLPYAALAGLFTLLVLALRDSGLQDRTWVVLIGATCAVGLVVVRQLASFAENARLLGELERTVREQQRTEAVLRAALGERDQLADRLHDMAFRDSLTGLANRSLFHDRLADALTSADRPSSDVAVFFLDLDDFKPVNDHHGHRAGDEVLREVARRILRCVRATDTASRLGGDEFAVILRHPTPSDVPAVAQRLIDAIGQPYWFEGVPLTIGVSIGVAVATGDCPDADQFLSHADSAMYHAKRNGKNSFHAYA